MRVRMLTGLSGPNYNLAVGDERDFPDAEAIRLVERGYAVPVDDAPVKETATRKSPSKEKRG